MFIFVSPCRARGAFAANALRQKKNGVLRIRPTNRPDAWDTVVQLDRPSADDPEEVMRCGTGAVADDASR
ncbi:hypothetical protein [Burkholderia humptydooensis]|uniref:hypothetical protein n=1 Tax=Burkholderia humptydooensis TaxID=430531 RepID=UPI001E4049C9|nr:hypothetical protein [Burkholderia humptydooensis]